MNSILIVLPILTLLMFDLGLTLQWSDFAMIIHRPKAVIVGLVGQLMFLPLVAFFLAYVFDLSPAFSLGLILIACCPGGSSSNIFSMLAKGDVALSVSLTALSSIITLVTIPFILQMAVTSSVSIQLPIGNLFVQNIVTMLVPVILGILVRSFFSKTARKIEKVLSKCAFPALMLLIAIFFFQHKENIIKYSGSLGLCAICLIILSAGISMGVSKLLKLNDKEQRTITIEVGMQNAAQAIALAASPFVFNDSTIAIPAIIYALMMNIILLIYVVLVRTKKQ